MKRSSLFSLVSNHDLLISLVTDSLVLSPGQVLTLSCKISGYSVTDSSYCTNFIRQPAGKALEWLRAATVLTGYSSLFQVTRESSSNTVTLKGQNMQTEDTAVYYCARESQ
uniref:Ig-like domain-containing protein n=1 Tax=Sinocyclocheilus anshuiensis TaxID=1608454 RepID=A0A671R3G2_9TELE